MSKISKELAARLVSVEQRKRSGKNLKIQGDGKSWERERSGEAHRESLSKPFIYKSDDGREILTMIEYPGEAIGKRVWDCAMIVSKYCELNPTIWKGMKVIEVGAGLGLVGLVLARLGAEKVLLTDLPKIVPALQQQIDRNELDSKVSARELIWGKNLDQYASLGKFDYIVICDMAAPILECKNLLDTIIHLFYSNPKAKLLLGCQLHRELTSPLLKGLSEQFKVQLIPQDKLHPEFQTNIHQLYWIETNKN